MSTLFICSWAACAANIVLFNVLYFCVVLLRIGDTGSKVKADSLINFRQQTYVAKYLELLTPQERSRWYNIYLKNWSTILLLLFSVGIVFLALSLLQGRR
jgi:hypothetical protein